jgi:hypothetical protein
MNTYNNHGLISKLSDGNFTSDISEIPFATIHPVCFVEAVDSDGVKVRALADNVLYSPTARVLRAELVKQVFSEGEWSNVDWSISGQKRSKLPKSATMGVFVNASTMEEVLSSEATESVDDTDKPIADTDPQEYEQKQILVDGYLTDFESLAIPVGEGGSFGMNTVLHSMISKALGVTLPA